LKASNAGINPIAARWAILGTLALVVVAFVAFALLRTPASPPPKEIADDPLLVAGRAIYLDRCVSCHGLKGRGDGPIARGLSGPPVGDLTDATWKHGDSPDQVRAVIARGVPNTAMPGWGKTLGEDGVRAAAAYVYYLAGREVPRGLRAE
jgi:cytochrome c oxidase cbb3-type subunit 3